MANAISELKLLKNELEEAAHKERAKISKAEVRLAQLEDRIWAVGETLRLWGDIEAQKTLEEGMKGLSPENDVLVPRPSLSID
jgi:hypothetical protein